jgi:hypothetical protein
LILLELFIKELFIFFNPNYKRKNLFFFQKQKNKVQYSQRVNYEIAPASSPNFRCGSENLMGEDSSKFFGMN